MGIGTELGQTSTEQNPTFSTLVRPDTTSCLSRRFRSIHRLGGAAVEELRADLHADVDQGLALREVGSGVRSRAPQTVRRPSRRPEALTDGPAELPREPASAMDYLWPHTTKLSSRRPGRAPGQTDQVLGTGRWASGRAEGWWRPRSVSCKAGPACPSVPRGLTAVDVQDDSRHE